MVALTQSGLVAAQQLPHLLSSRSPGTKLRPIGMAVATASCRPSLENSAKCRDSQYPIDTQAKRLPEGVARRQGRRVRRAMNNVNPVTCSETDGLSESAWSHRDMVFAPGALAWTGCKDYDCMCSASTTAADSVASAGSDIDTVSFHSENEVTPLSLEETFASTTAVVLPSQAAPVRRSALRAEGAKILSSIGGCSKTRCELPPTQMQQPVLSGESQENLLYQQMTQQAFLAGMRAGFTMLEARRDPKRVDMLTVPLVMNGIGDGIEELLPQSSFPEPIWIDFRELVSF